jgi:TolB-like protein/Flp pilus assembly protein TadD
LIDAISGHHLWANHYDKNIKAFFHLLDEIAKKVAVELQVKLTEGELARGSLKTKNFEAWGYATTAYSLLKRLTKENNAKARELSEKAVKLDPGYGYAWGALGAAHTNDAQLGWSESRDNSFKLAVECTDKSLKLDESLPCSTALKGRLHLLQGQFEKAIAIGEKAISLGPSHDLPYSLLSLTMLYAGRFEESITLVKKAMRLNPSYPAFLISVLARDYYFTERYNEAIEAGKRLLERAQKGGYPPHLAHLGLSATYMELGREEEARAHVVEALGMNPKFSLDHYRKVFIFKDPAHTKRLYIAMRKAGLPDRSPLPLPKKPSIAVLPFTNLSDDPKQEYFSDGMTDDLTTDLSKISGLHVIARNSSFTYKGKSVKVQQVGKELGVRYILEGSVRRVGNDVRINAQLIDATSGHHLWADRYDGEMKEIFALQDRITRKIVSALAVKLSVGERKLVESMETDSIEAYDAFLKGYEHFLGGTVDGLAASIKYFEKAIELDKNYGRAYAALAKAYFMSPRQGQKEFYKIWPVCMLRARHYLQMAMKRPTAISHNVATLLAIQRRKYEKAMAEAERALALNPSGYEANHAMGTVLLWAGRPKEAINYFKRALELDPLHPGSPLYLMGFAHFNMGQYNEAVDLAKRALTHYPKNANINLVLAPAYAHLGRDQEARDALKDYLKVFLPLKPDLKDLFSPLPFKEQKDFDRLAEGLVKAGFPGRPSEYCKISKQNKLTGEEIRKLLFGHTAKGIHLGMQWSVSRDKEGKCTSKDFSGKRTGKSWIEGDRVFTQFESVLEGRKFDIEVYRNPGGTPESLNEYCYISDFALLPFSVVD